MQSVSYVSEPGQVVEFVHFDKQRKGHVVAENLEAPVAQQIFNVAAGSGGQIIDAKNFVAVVEQRTAKMCPGKARVPGN
jgi:hypothetical protein